MATKASRVEPALLRVKRMPHTDDGIVFNYLAAQRQPQTDLACEAIRPYWLPLALKERGVKGKQLKSVGQKAIAQLMQQIEIIRLECGLSSQELPFAYSVSQNTTIPQTSLSMDNKAEYDELASPPPLNNDAVEDDFLEDGSC
ncbi:MAG: hypothetical protein KME64_42610 [Scytonematopsis contorta HA4267-MV1]|jgi:hypothetical protein|nr:hypothetical protein [Scytonematopsis contorta HA4267-MV1]